MIKNGFLDFLIRGPSSLAMIIRNKTELLNYLHLPRIENLLKSLTSQEIIIRSIKLYD